MKKIISLLVIPSVITLTTTTIGITTNQIINSIQQNQVPKLLNPPTQNISQTFRTKQIYINANDAKEIPLLEYVENKNSLLPFLKGSQDTIELDLNVWKPLGMEDEIFLRNLKFNLSNGYFQTSYLNSISQSKLIKYNVKPTNYPNNSLFPSVQNKENYDNLLPKKTNDQTYWDEKLVFNFYKNDSEYRENNYAFIVFDIKHERSEEQHKPNSVNRLLIRPMLRYNLDTSSKTITIPSQNMKISLISEFLNFNPLARISVDSYLSDSQKLNLYSGSLGKVENYISFDTEKGDNELILSSSSKPGHKIPTLEIDTSNMYLDKDINHINTKYQVDIEGLKIKNAKFKIRTSSGGSVNNFDIIQNDENDENNLKYGYQNLDISFDISESDFPNASSEKVFHFPIFRQSYINDLPSYGGNPEAKLLLEIKVKPKVNQATKEKIPFQYEVSEIKFLANSYNNVNPTLEIDVEFKVMQSQIYVKTKPKNFSFSRMQNQLIKPQRNEFVIDGQNQPYNYSSNVFDDTYFVDQMTNKIKNNYEISYDHTNNKFKETILQSQDFLNFGVDTTNPLDLFNLPFTKIKYTGKEEEFRQRGQMEFSYSTVNTNKFFKNINFIQRIKYELRDNQKEMVDISINHDNLNSYANKVSDINVLVSNLNNLNLEQKFKLINISNKDDDKNHIIALLKILNLVLQIKI